MVQAGSTRDSQAKEAARIIYESSGQPIRPSSYSPNYVPNGVNSSLSEAWMHGGRLQMSAVRRTFCLLVTFDIGLIFIIWVIYTQLLPTSGVNNRWDQFIDQVQKYDIKKSLFDIVMLSTVRLTLLLLAYALFRINHWWMIAITTTLSCSFLLAKCFVFNFADTEHDNALGYVLLIVSFSMAWVETWFLDFKVLPSEKKARKKVTMGHYDERSPLLGDVEGQRRGGEDAEYYSPENSDESDTDVERSEGTRGHSRQASHSSVNSFISFREQEYIQLGDELMDIVWEMHQTKDGWKLEKGDNPEDGIVHSIYNKKIKRKVYRLQSEVDFRAQYLWEECAYNLEENSHWNPTCVESRVLQAISENTDIAYTIAAEAAGGIVAARDFVNLRRWGERNGQYLSLVTHTTFSGMPHQKKYVRGENGPGGFLFVPIPNEQHKCQFLWYLNTNLKGWLPQQAIDVGLTGVMLDYLKYLRIHIEDLKNREKS
ncbi:STARD3 [Mytilus coruscus]|uniref:STARD3 n=1 Tax=Mytilus coruscus TaxID=42192 RepID=A0A6J8DS14_MYTCO|nr:STARD3 [Mytilus coruscus]